MEVGEARGSIGERTYSQILSQRLRDVEKTVYNLQNNLFATHDSTRKCRVRVCMLCAIILLVLVVTGGVVIISMSVLSGHI
jgi:hypothetical protein